jgi:DNA replicative helicase MCM subunit Mcm2 (Cdc46/Mcm family)
MDMSKELLADLEEEIVQAETVEEDKLIVHNDFFESWRGILDRSRQEGMSNNYVVDINALPEEMQKAVEKDWDLIYAMIRKFEPDAEIRLTGARWARIRDLTQADVGRLREVRGVIVRFDEDRRVKVLKDCWQCEQGHVVRSTGPQNKDRCSYMTNQVSVRGKKLSCGAMLVRQVFSEQKRVDLFCIRIEEREDNPDLEASAIDVLFEGGDLVRDVLRAIHSNEKYVRITGIVKLVGTKTEGGMNGMLMMVDGMQIEVIQTKRTSRYDALVRRHIPPDRMRAHVMKLVRSFAPHISGRLDLKLGLMALAVGGVKKEIDPTVIRGNLNVLIIGSPATGKTQVLKFMERVRSNSIYVSGRQASAIGLTAGTGGGETGTSGLWARRRQVFMGAYALANGGVVLLDEVHKRKKEDLEHLASVMDDNQEIIVAKSGLFKKIPVNCASLHAGNPRGSGMYNPKLGLVEQMDEAFWLLSRYDLCFTLQNQTQDQMSSLRHSVSETYRRAKAFEKKGEIEDENTTPLTPDEERMILEGEYYPPDYLAAEIEYLMPQTPILDVGSKQWEMMLEFFEKFAKQKMLGTDVDVFDQRKFNSLARVSEAVAKLYRSPTVQMLHMEEALNLFRVTIANVIHVPSPDIGYVRFSRWLMEQFIDTCYICDGRGCEACGSMGGRLLPVSFGDCADYPYQEEARTSWDYLVAMGGLVRIEESLGGQSYRITEVSRNIAQGGWREGEEKDIAAEALAMMRS